MALWYSGNKEDAEDILQESFIRLWKMREKLDEYESIEALAVKILKNLCVDKYRNKREFETLHKIGTLLTPQREHEQSIIEFEKYQELRKIIADLGEPYSTVLYLRAIESLDIKEISEIMNMKPNTVEVNLSRARKKIREKLKSIRS